MTLQAPSQPIFSSVTAQEMDAAIATDPTYWARQIREPVRFSDAMANLLELYPSAVLLETGPNQALSTLTRQQTLDHKQQFIVSSLPHAKQDESDAHYFTAAVGSLWQSAIAIDWNAVADAPSRNRLHLPLYRFQRKRYSFETELENRAQASPKQETSASPVSASDNQNTNGNHRLPPDGVPLAKPANGFMDSGTIGSEVGMRDGSPNGGTSAANSVTRDVISMHLELMNRQMNLLRASRAGKDFGQHRE
ncbi:MAG: hypothetical protein AAF497_15515 [Planctomycetota bacterium]